MFVCPRRVHGQHLNDTRLLMSESDDDPLLLTDASPRPVKRRRVASPPSSVIESSIVGEESEVERSPAPFWDYIVRDYKPNGRKDSSKPQLLVSVSLHEMCEMAPHNATASAIEERNASAVTREDQISNTAVIRQYSHPSDSKPSY